MSVQGTHGPGKRTGAAMALLRSPNRLALLPAAVLAAWFLGGEYAAIGLSLALPILFLALGQRAAPVLPGQQIAAPPGGLPPRESVVAALGATLAGCAHTGKSTACLVLCIDSANEIADRYGREALDKILRRTGERITGTLREFDLVMPLDGARFAVALAPVARADLESVIQIAARMREAVGAPLSIDATTTYVSASVGFCLGSRAPERSGEALLRAAEHATEEARRNGPGAVRAYSTEVEKAVSDRHALRDCVELALESGQIVPYFQPQLSTDTGRITGFEALARWMHPERGLLPPSEFLPAINAAGLSTRLGEVILYHAFSALKSWDAASFSIPTVAVNFSQDELRNPGLVEKLKWELDRFDLTPSRLTIEILESVVAETTHDVVVHNIAALSRLGCGIDLDDFGTGHASIANVRRFNVTRIKIDRSFITRVDCDQNQQRMVSAILSMAERLGLETIGEGVEMIGEHAMLSQLGCSHVQGFGIARPMAFEDTAAWIVKHNAKLAHTPRLGRKAG